MHAGNACPDILGIDGLLKRHTGAEEAPAADALVQSADTGTEFSGDLLLVEDNRVNQLVAKKLLGDLGFDVHLAENGQEALDMVTERAWRVVLMDCQMPVMDGYEATTAIRHVRAKQLVIAMTANAMQGDREKCIASGMDDYVSKPVRKDALVEVLARWLARNETRASEG